MSDSTLDRVIIARIAGNLLSGKDAMNFWIDPGASRAQIVAIAVATARAIVAEVERTRPTPEEE